jgi:asparagine synthase (glutamine-hydrolysing)
MCGVFALLNDSNFSSSFGYQPSDFIQKQFNKGKSRGPEFSKLTNGGINLLFGFHRLAINGLNNKSNQPITIGFVTLICNGEIYNYKELYSLMNVTPETDSDCEVIAHLYLKYGMEQTLQMLDGVFAFILCDNTNVLKNSSKISPNKVYIARDPYGVRPLYVLKHATNKKKTIGVASEIKCLTGFKPIDDAYSIEHFQPGTYSCYELPNTAMAYWKCVNECKSYHSTGFNSIIISRVVPCEIGACMGIKNYLMQAVEKRCTTTERPIACLLSGGLDSSLVTALVNEFRQQFVPGCTPLETYSIGLADSEDLKYAKIVSDYLGTKHTEIILTEQDFLDAIPEVIYAIESYDTTSVRASIGNYLLGKYISKNSEAKVIFNGDGSDELCGGYLYMHKCPDAIEFDRESRRLLKDIHKFDVLRSDKCISSHGLEPRTPFLDRAWVQYYLSIDPRIRYHPGNAGQCEKYLLRTAFSEKFIKNMEGKPLLPDSILWRRKEAFSDGVSKTSRSLYQIIEEHIETLPETNVSAQGVNAITKEQKYYKSIFEKHYPNALTIVPYYWMPKYVNAKDASARTLDLYNNLAGTEKKALT